MRIALRTQQVIAHETGVVNTIDPLGGSYYVEHLTNELERQAYEYFDRIEKLGGVVAGDQGELLPARDRRGVVPLPVGGRGRAARRRRRQPLRARGRAAAPDPQDRPGARAASRSTRVQALRRGATRAAVEAALARLKEDAARDDRNLMHADRRRRRAPT